MNSHPENGNEGLENLDQVANQNTIKLPKCKRCSCTKGLMLPRVCMCLGANADICFDCLRDSILTPPGNALRDNQGLPMCPQCSTVYENIRMQRRRNIDSFSVYYQQIEGMPLWLGLIVHLFLDIAFLFILQTYCDAVNAINSDAKPSHKARKGEHNFHLAVYVIIGVLCELVNLLINANLWAIYNSFRRQQIIVLDVLTDPSPFSLVRALLKLAVIILSLIGAAMVFFFAPSPSLDIIVKGACLIFWVILMVWLVYVLNDVFTHYGMCVYVCAHTPDPNAVSVHKNDQAQIKSPLENAHSVESLSGYQEGVSYREIVRSTQEHEEEEPED